MPNVILFQPDKILFSAFGYNTPQYFTEFLLNNLPQIWDFWHTPPPPSSKEMGFLNPNSPLSGESGGAV